MSVVPADVVDYGLTPLASRATLELIQRDTPERRKWFIDDYQSILEDVSGGIWMSTSLGFVSILS